jgi:undecaprenyl-diphosphatase
MPEHAGEKPVEEMKDTLQRAAKAETSSPSVRSYRTLLFQAGLVSAIVTFAFLTFLVETTPSFPIDLEITRAIQSIRSPFFAGLMQFISWPGFFPQFILITLLIPFVFYMYGLRWESVASLLAAIFSAGTNQFVKEIIQRPRPAADLVDVFAVLQSYSFPSGHVMFYLGFFGFIWYLVYILFKQSLIRSLVLGFVGGLILLVGMSRIYLGQHWASDVLGAYLLGGLILVGIILFYRWGKKRFFVRQPVAPHDFEKE